jgi:L-threonylcarbamoyladenylate synthase
MQTPEQTPETPWSPESDALGIQTPETLSSPENDAIGTHATEMLAPDAAGLARAVDLLRDGQVLAFPTETVYGLGGDAKSDLAVARIYAAKGRPRFNPLIAHVSDMTMARSLAVFDARAEALAAQFWPGPLTLVLPLRPGSGLSELVTAELPTVALRLPAHPLARALIAAFGGPLAAPSANRSGLVSPTRPEHVIASLSGRIAAVIDGGSCDVGVESTILGLYDATELLRPGGVSVEAIEAFTGPLVSGGHGPRPTAPGQLASHYATQAPIRLNATDTRPGEVRLGFGPGVSELNLSLRGDLVEAAANLFHLMQEADQLAAGRPIAVAPIPETGLGRAINDRLRRAAAPR